jgi:tRNA nucleotidyltransferase (CCA-adding enzyme)
MMEDFMNLEDILKGIYPDDTQRNCLTGVVSKMGNILKNGSGYLKVKKVTPAGSVGKETNLKGHFEVDCVYILERDGYSYNDYFWEVERALKENLSGVWLERKHHSISFMLEKKIGNVSVDLIPAFEINSPEQMTEVKNRQAYYGSTALLQKKYFRKVSPDYKQFTDLVRLLKLWRNTWEVPLSSYMLELIVTNAIYDTKEGNDFSFFLEVCFRTIQSFIDGRAIVPVWEYSSNAQYRNGLLIIDPSDPSENIAGDISDDDKRFIYTESSRGVTYISGNDYSYLGNYED